ncbi:MAG: MBL fold metallo-hydrolase, partial [Halobacteriovoraceae bacterium]|nr:MBL fold metallo-hydrolase [Halobacteriovoraceae bacterium]
LLDLFSIDEEEREILGENFSFFMLPHGPGKTMGFIHGKFAYLIDCHVIPKKLIERLRGLELDVLLIDCVRREAHQTHLNVEKAFFYIEKIAPKRAGLIHMAHQLDHEDLLGEAENFFDFSVFPVYDGQQLYY